MIGHLMVASWLIVSLAACGTPSPMLAFAEGTPSDLQELGRAVWDDFLAAFPDQADCVGEVILEGDRTLAGSGAYYLPDNARVVLAIPGTAAHLRHSLIHELAHHLEHACADHADLRADFLREQGLSPDTPWFEGPSWEETPSEQYAEAAVRVVMGRPVKNYRLTIAPGAMEVVRKWGGGG